MYVEKRNGVKVVFMFLLVLFLSTNLLAKEKKKQDVDARCAKVAQLQIDLLCKEKPPKKQEVIRGIFVPNMSQMIAKCKSNYKESKANCLLDSKDIKSFLACDKEQALLMFKFRKKMNIEEATAFLARPLATDSEKRKKCKKASENMLKIMRKALKLPMIPDVKKFNAMVDGCEKYSDKKIDCVLHSQNKDELSKCKGL